MCMICQMPKDTRLEIEALIQGGTPVRDIESRYSVGKNVVQKHKNKCMMLAPDDAQSKLKEMAEKLEGKGEWKAAGEIYAKLVNVGDNQQEDVYSFLGRIAPQLCQDCKKLILEG